MSLPNIGFFQKEIWMVIVRNLALDELLKMKLLNKSLLTVIKGEMMTRASTNTVDDVVTIALLLDHCYQEQGLRYVIHKEKSYYPCNTMWYDRSDDPPDQEHDPNIQCTGYECHTGPWSKDNLHYVYPDDGDVIKYVFKEDEQARINRSGGYLSLGSLLYFPRPITLVNDMGKNDDHRGSNHINIELDFACNYRISAGIHTLYDIVQGCYRIKHHKFHNQYEGFFTFIYDDDIVDDKKISELADYIYLAESGWIAKPVIDHGS